MTRAMSNRIGSSSTDNLAFLGNKEILSYRKIAFLCSRKCPSQIILKSLEWAKEKKNKGECIISGFHSKIEKDVFNILLNGMQPIILVLARGMKTYWPQNIKDAIEQNRLLVISPFSTDEKHVTQDNANKRNELMTSIADEIFVAYASPEGNLDKLIQTVKEKPVIIFTPPGY